LRNLKELALPQTVEEFWEKKREYGPRAVVIAGGTEIVTQPPDGVECLIDIRLLTSDTIEEQDEVVKIGAATTMEALTHSSVAAKLGSGMLREATRLGWPIAVRSAATIGGNVAGGDPFADCPPVLLALAAQLILETVDGPKTVPADEFFLDYRRTAAEDAILMSIAIPKGSEESKGVFFKVAPAAVDKAMVNLGVYAEIVEGRCRQVRVAVGAVTRIPHRVTSVEKLMMNELLTPELVDEAAESVAKNVEPMLDMRAPAEHRRSLLSALFKRAVHSLAQAG
jgi:CO/xanthine dehydrogenase FAD-binding subunit